MMVSMSFVASVTISRSVPQNCLILWILTGFAPTFRICGIYNSCISSSVSVAALLSYNGGGGWVLVGADISVD